MYKTTTLLRALDDIQGNAPMKQPPAAATVGFANSRRYIDPDAADDAIEQAFNEGHTRAMWEAAQIAAQGEQDAIRDGNVIARAKAFMMRPGPALAAVVIGCGLFWLAVLVLV